MKRFNRLSRLLLLAFAFVLMGALMYMDTDSAFGATSKCTVTFKSTTPVSVTVTKTSEPSGTKVKNTKKKLTSKLTSKTRGVYKLAPGVYSYHAYKQGYYTYDKIFIVTKSDVKKKKKTLNVYMHPKTYGGYESSATLCRWNSEISKLYGLNDLKSYKPVDTPSLNADKAAHQFSTNEEKDAYLRAVCDNSDIAYYYPESDIAVQPVVLLTKEDISSASTLSEALEIMNKSGKLNVMYQAQMHGNEPGASDGALFTVKNFATDDASLMDDLNICVIPCANPYGAQYFSRYNEAGADMNRDFLTSKYPETQSLQAIYRTMKPEVFFDGHEEATKAAFVDNINSKTQIVESLSDVDIGENSNGNQDRALGLIAREIRGNTFQICKTEGLRAFEYINNSIEQKQTNCKASAYSTLHQGLAFTIETPGIRAGKDHFRRRVYAQYYTIKTICQQCAENSDTIRQAVANARTNAIESNRHYSESNVLTLNHQRKKCPITYKRPAFYLSGKLYKYKDVPVYESVPERTRPKPTAYVLSLEAEGAADIKDYLDVNHMDYYIVEPGATFNVAGYKYDGQFINAELLPEEAHTFAKGAFVIPTAQFDENIICLVMEPDCGDNSGFAISMLQRKFVEMDQIFRYTGPNPSEGIEYEIVEVPEDEDEDSDSGEESGEGNGDEGSQDQGEPAVTVTE